MTKILNFALKIKGGSREGAHTKSSDPATPQNLERAPERSLPFKLNFFGALQQPVKWGTF